MVLNKRSSKGSWLRAFVLVGALFILQRSSAARADFTYPNQGTGIIGLVEGDGRIWVGVKPLNTGSANPPCGFRRLSDGPALTSDLLLHGTAVLDGFVIVAAATDWCGFRFLPFATNGKRIRLWGEGGDDVMINWSSPSVQLNGGAGNDNLADRSNSSAASLAGNDGDDTLSMCSNSYAYGDNGNDTLSAGSSCWPGFFDGGNGYDRYCAANPASLVRVEGPLCN